MPREINPKTNKPKTNAKTKPIKFTPEFCLQEVTWMENHMNSEKGKNIIFIAELCLARGYSPQKWSEELQKFPEIEEITEAIKRIEVTLEMRLSKGMLAGKLNATGAIFTLKNKYKWRDKHEVESSGTLEVNNPELAAIMKLLSDKN